jgi:hypothetical protein
MMLTRQLESFFGARGFLRRSLVSGAGAVDTSPRFRSAMNPTIASTSSLETSRPPKVGISRLSPCGDHQP